MTEGNFVLLALEYWFFRLNVQEIAVGRVVGSSKQPKSQSESPVVVSLVCGENWQLYYVALVNICQHNRCLTKINVVFSTELKCDAGDPLLADLVLNADVSFNFLLSVDTCCQRKKDFFVISIGYGRCKCKFIFAQLYAYHIAEIVVLGAVFR